MAKAKLIKARVLSDTVLEGKEYKSGAFVAFPEKQAKSLIGAGQIDSHEDAVQYCIDQGVTCVEHVDASDPLQAASAVEPVAEVTTGQEG